jgi:hypothetical protein
MGGVIVFGLVGIVSLIAGAWLLWWDPATVVPRTDMALRVDQYTGAIFQFGDLKVRPHDNANAGAKEPTWLHQCSNASTLPLTISENGVMKVGILQFEVEQTSLGSSGPITTVCVIESKDYEYAGLTLGVARMGDPTGPDGLSWHRIWIAYEKPWSVRVRVIMVWAFAVTAAAGLGVWWAWWVDRDRLRLPGKA